MNITPELITVIGEGLKLIVTLLAKGTPDANEKAKAMALALSHGTEGKTSAELVLAELQSFRDDLEQNDNDALEALRARFATDPRG